MSKVAGGKRVRRSEQEWRALLARFEHSAMTVSAFCRREGICAASLYRWRRLLGEAGVGDRPMAPADHSPGFVDLGALSSTGADRLELKLDLGGGLVLHLVRG
jgi:transposase-like protein